MHGNLALVCLFLSHPDINIDSITKLGATPLWDAVRYERLEITKCLLDPEACNIRIDYGLTKKDEKMIERKQLDYHKGANPNGVSHHIPMHMAAIASISFLELLVQYGVSVDHYNIWDHSACACARSQGQS